MARSDKRFDYFKKLCSKDRVLKWLWENDKHGGITNYRLDQLRMYAGIDRFPFVYYSPDFFTQPDNVKRFVNDKKVRLMKKHPHRFEQYFLTTRLKKKTS